MRVFAWAPLALSLAVFACSDSDPDTDGGTTNPDANSNVDSGLPGDAGTPQDGGNNPVDSGVVQGACNPVDGTGCLAADNYCVLQPQQDQGACRLLIGPVGHEQTCDQAQQNCEAGYACVAFQGDTTPICRKVCSQLNGMGCAGLTGTSTAGYLCNIAVQGSANYAFCGPRPPPPRTCDPLNNTCPNGQNCGPVSQTEVGCIPNGNVPLNGMCGGAAGACQRPGICAGLNGGMPLCNEPCSLTTMTCSTPNYQCVNVGRPYGLCVPM